MIIQDNTIKLEKDKNYQWAYVDFGEYGDCVFVTHHKDSVWHALYSGSYGTIGFRLNRSDFRFHGFSKESFVIPEEYVEKFYSQQDTTDSAEVSE